MLVGHRSITFRGRQGASQTLSTAGRGNWTAKADLVAARGNEIIRVQVKTGAHSGNRKFHYQKPAGDDTDLLIAVDHAGNILVEEYRSGPKIAQAA